MGPRERCLEVQDVLDVSTSPGIDTLVVVADDHEVLRFPRQELQETELCAVRVLILVDQEEGEPTPIFPQDLWMPFQEFHRFHEEVVEIEGVVVPESLLIHGKHLRHVPSHQVEAVPILLDEGFGWDELVLRSAHMGSKGLGTPPLGIDPDLLLGPFDLTEALVLVVDGERG